MQSNNINLNAYCNKMNMQDIGRHFDVVIINFQEEMMHVQLGKLGV
jgi:hypothetical protein